MNWIIDVLALLLILGLSIYGYRRGFFNSTINLLLVVLVIFGAIGLAYITTTTFLTTEGVVDELYYAFLNLLGNSKIEGGQEIVEQIAYYLATGVLVILTFIIYDVLLHLVRKLILKFFAKTIFKLGLFRFIDKLLGLVFNLAISLFIVFGLMALIRFFASTSNVLIYVNEFFKSCEILGIFYDINPLNNLFV